MSLKYEQVIIIGSGALAANCILQLHRFDVPLIIFDSNTTQLSTLANVANERGIKYINQEKEETFSELVALEKKSILLLLGCNYIIPKEVIHNPNLSIINYHNSLLPKHPGRNAEAWAIFDQDRYTGITWHYVDDRIDAGDIIFQREISIKESDSALTLLKLQNELAFESFKLLVNDLLAGTLSRFKQNMDLRGKLHLSHEVPNDGFIDPTWNIGKIKAFLRAMDYGALRRMGQPKIYLNNKVFTWKKTSFADDVTGSDNITFNQDENHIVINKGGKAIKLIDVLTNGG
ncbi:formyltransferase family protein [Cohnella sp.]|uniref:formyltransferase family protein n=1 Tax=Cohnella sp. TaxID=1883426 RepID=UPI003704A508